MAKDIKAHMHSEGAECHKEFWIVRQILEVEESLLESYQVSLTYNSEHPGGKRYIPDDQWIFTWEACHILLLAERAG